MNYNVDEMFLFWETDGGYSVEDYVRKNTPAITEIEIPAEFNGKPVVEVSGFHTAEFIKRVVIPPSVRLIRGMAFRNCSALEDVELSEGLEEMGISVFENTAIKSITLPKSLKLLSKGAIGLCPELECVKLNGTQRIELNNFRWCPKLPPEFPVVGMVCSTDMTAPIHNDDLPAILLDLPDYPSDLFRPEVFEILAKNNCFRECDLAYLFQRIINAGKLKLFPITEQHGMLETAALVDELIEYSVKRGKTESAAYLLDLKNRKFGFKGGGDFEF